MISRRKFLKDTLSAAVCATAAGTGHLLEAQTLHVPLGLQLYSLREILPNDYDGTLRHVAAVGYRQVEAAGFFGHSAVQVKQAMASAGLELVGAHYSYGDLTRNLDDTLRFAEGVGLKEIICPSPSRKTPTSGHGSHAPLTLEDWRWNAEQFNQIGKKVKSAGFRFGFHNHYEAFRIQNGVLPYNELLRLTDPSLVMFELDCGWMIVGGQDPVKYLTEHPTRYCCLHLKDFKRGEPVTSRPPPPPTELGRGSIDYRPIFRAAAKAHVRHAYVEQEGFDVPVWESLKIDADYLRKLES